MEKKQLPPVNNFSIVVMAFNEARNLERAVREIHATARQIQGEFEVIIIDDGSSDGTPAIAAHLAVSLPGVRAIYHPENQGLGGVYRTGFNVAKNEAISFFPADGQFPSGILLQFASLIQDQEIVMGYVPQRRGSPLARFLSWAERIIYHFLLGNLPRFQGILMFRRVLLDRFELKSKGRGWTILLEFILRASRANCLMISVPIELRPRLSGKSKVNNMKTIWANLRQAVALRNLM
jgi:glycosyltransferase involved in cell wall biosynthesis